MENRWIGILVLVPVMLGGCSRENDPTELPQPETEHGAPVANDPFGDQVQALEKAARVQRTLDAAATNRRESLERQERP